MYLFKLYNDNKHSIYITANNSMDAFSKALELTGNIYVHCDIMR